MVSADRAGVEPCLWHLCHPVGHGRTYALVLAGKPILNREVDTFLARLYRCIARAPEANEKKAVARAVKETMAAVTSKQKRLHSGAKGRERLPKAILVALRGEEADAVGDGP